MQRLTEFHNGIWGMSVQAVKDGYDKYSIFSKLAEYEDTGLKPSEIASLKEALERSGTECKQLHDDMNESQEEIDKLRNKGYEYQRLEQEGLLVRLPCRTGNTVYAYSEFGRTIVPYTVEGIHIFENVAQINCFWYNHDDCMEGTEFEPSDFGKTVFLTEAEAEQALKGDNNYEQ